MLRTGHAAACSVLHLSNIITFCNMHDAVCVFMDLSSGMTCSAYDAAPLQVYLRIKAAMELAEEARLERDAATTTTATLRRQLEATQVCVSV